MSSVLVRSLGLATVLCGALVGCGGGGGSSTSGNLNPSGSDAATSPADLSTAPSSDAGTPPQPDASTITAPTGAWQVASLGDRMAAGFDTITITADGTYTQTGRTDGVGETGQWSQPASISIDSSFGEPPAGLTGPYLELDDEPLGDQTFVYGWSEPTDRSSLTLTLWARTNGMGLRWAQGQVIHLVPADGTLPATPAGTWQAASEADAANAGFQTLELDASGFYAQTGRADGQPLYGNWQAVDAPAVDPSFGSAPAGMTGPYISLDNSQYSGDGQWVYGWSNDGTTLTLTLYAQRNGMGLRWAAVKTSHFTKGSSAQAPTGSWKTATTADKTAAGFSTIVIAFDGTYTQTGRTDGQTLTGTWSSIESIDVDPDFGNPPSGMKGPYVELSNLPTGDGTWDYGWTIEADGSLTLRLYAETMGMGLRWASPVKTIKLVRN